MTPIEKRPTDEAYSDSPDVGLSNCTCSRCRNIIGENEVPLRAWDIVYDLEWRYCESCMANAGLKGVGE